MKLNIGYVCVSGYVYKVRRVFFVLVKGKVDFKEVVRVVGEFNLKIFEEFQKLGVEKEDVVRISVEFFIKDGLIVWDYDILFIEVYKKSEEERFVKVMEEVEVRECELDQKIREVEELVLKLRSVVEEFVEKIEELKQEYIFFKLKVEMEES